MSKKDCGKVQLDSDDFPASTTLPGRSTWVRSVQEEMARLVAKDMDALGATSQLSLGRPLRGEAGVAIRSDLPDDGTEMGRQVREMREVVGKLYPDASPHMSWVIDLMSYLGDVLVAMKHDDGVEARYAPFVAAAWLAAHGLPPTKAGFIKALSTFLSAARDEYRKAPAPVREPFAKYVAARVAVLCGATTAAPLETVRKALGAEPRVDYDEHLAELCRYLGLTDSDDPESVARQARER